MPSMHADLESEELIEAAARALPALLFPGCEAIALACFTYTFSPAVLLPYWELAAQKIKALGCPSSELPTLEEVSRVLMRNRTAGKLALVPDKSRKQQRNETQQVMLEGEGSLLPLYVSWADLEVFDGLLMYKFALAFHIELLNSLCW